MSISANCETQCPSICFLILHYKNADETVACIESIISTIAYEHYRIVVVDNGSGNGTGEELKRRYATERFFHLIALPQNLGFARGNNVGLEFATEQLGCRFVCMMNSDTRVLQSDFCEQIFGLYKDTGSAVIGPKIKNPDGSEELPHGLPTTTWLKKNTRVLRVKRIFAERGIDLDPLDAAFYKTISRIRGREGEKLKAYDTNQSRADVVLHGSCLIFTPAFFDQYNGLDERTFLYHEEDLLFLRLRRAGLHSLYAPELKIFHNHHATTKSLAKDDLSFRAFRMKHLIASRKILLQELRTWEEEQARRVH